MTTDQADNIPAAQLTAEGGRSIHYIGGSSAKDGIHTAALPYTKRDAKKPRRWVLNALTFNGPSMILTGQWRRPSGDRSAEYNTIKYWTDLAQLLERGKFSALL